LVNDDQAFNIEILRYLNRLSDLCWLLARKIEQADSSRAGEIGGEAPQSVALPEIVKQVIAKARLGRAASNPFTPLLHSLHIFVCLQGSLTASSTSARLSAGALIFPMADTTELVPELLEAGVHFGTRPSAGTRTMRPYIFEKKNQIYIINLDETVKHYSAATSFCKK